MNPENPIKSESSEESSSSIQPIKPIQKKHSLRLAVSIMTVMVLVVGVFGAVNLSLQSQDNRGHAASYSNYTNYYSGSGGTTTSLSGLCIRVAGITVGCSGGSQPTTVQPCGYTGTTSSGSSGGLINVLSGSSGGLINVLSGGGSSTYVAPTAPCPTPTAADPYNIPPTPTTPPYNGGYGNGTATVNLKVYLHGIGNGGDNVNPTSQGNMTPVHPQRNASVQVFNASNQMISDNQASLAYDAGNGVFKGAATLQGIQTGAYTIKIKTDQYLRGLVPGIQNLAPGQTITLGEVRLVDGDVNGDNQVNILDYNIMIGCYSDLSAAVSCNAQNNLKSDLNDDGHVNQYDYNLFIRELSNVNGQ